MTDVRKDECRGRGRGRGLNRSSLGNFKPKECLITADDISKLSQFSKAFSFFLINFNK